MPDDTVYVGRPTKWGNPYRLGKEAESREAAVEMYAEMFNGLSEQERETLLEPLRGKDLACWCPPGAPCHGDFLVTQANKIED